MKEGYWGMTATTCAWCQAHSNMTPISTPKLLTLPHSYVGVQAAFQCNHCRKLSIGTTIVSEYEQPSTQNIANEWWNKQSRIQWTPEKVGGKEFAYVPEHIASTADEAYRCRSIEADRAAILMARSVIEATCKDQGVEGRNLAGKIDAMLDRKLIRPHTHEAAHELRFLGNDMAHGDFVDPVDEEDSDAVLEVMSEILNEVYQGPARILRMRRKRQKE
jgi:hypothetical protein